MRLWWRVCITFTRKLTIVKFNQLFLCSQTSVLTPLPPWSQPRNTLTSLGFLWVITLLKILIKSHIKYTLNPLSCLSSGELYRPSDETTLHILRGVLLHPPPPHRCRDGLPSSAKGDLHRTLTAEQGLRSETISIQSWTRVSIGSFWASRETERAQAAERTAGAHRLDIAEYLSVSKNAINVKCLSFFYFLKHGT